MNSDFICLESSEIKALLTPIGASLRSLFVKDQRGNWRDVVLGYETQEEYKTNPGSLGAVVGRYASRIGNARFELCGTTYTLDKNDGRNCLHSGFNRYETRVFHLVSKTHNKAVFQLKSPHGDQGFPGNAIIRVSYTIIDDCSLRIDYYAEADRETVFNLTNHSYFQLDGHGAGDIKGHSLILDSSEYIVFDEEGIPTGELRKVEDSIYDFRKARSLDHDYDNCFVLNNEKDKKWTEEGPENWNKPCAILSSKDGSIVMEVFTNSPIMVLYTGQYLNVKGGKDGANYGPGQGICLETEGYPDAMNQPGFPLEIYGPSNNFSSYTILRFSRKR